MTFLTTATGASAILPDEYGQLIVKPVTDSSLATQTSLATVASTASHEFHIPSVEEDAAAEWVAEGQEITPSEPVVDEITTVPSKIAALVPISRELANDSSPDAQKLVGDSIARAIVNKLNVAWLGNVIAPAPKGLGSLTTMSTVSIPLGGLTSLDYFNEAISEAEGVGAMLTGWVMSPDDALIMANLKAATGSNQPLLANPRNIAGLPVFVSRHIAAGTMWGIDAARVFTVVREDVELAVSEHSYFTSDRIAVRAIMRVGFSFPQPDALVKLTVATV